MGNKVWLAGCIFNTTGDKVGSANVLAPPVGVCTEGTEPLDTILVAYFNTGLDFILESGFSQSDIYS